MTESTCLHIQDCESGPIRVVELPWISVRIGRATYCEVRLAEPDLPDEVCRLQRRGLSWRLLPLHGEYPLFMNGHRLGGVCPLPLDVPFRAGPYCFTLRHDRSAQPDWQMYAGPAPPQEDPVEKSPLADIEPEPRLSQENSPSLAPPNYQTEKPSLADIEPEPRLLQENPPSLAPCDCQIAAPLLSPEKVRLRQAATKLAKSPRPHEPRRYVPTPTACYEQWDSRWKTLSARVSARAETRLKSPTFSRPDYQSNLESIPLRETHTPHAELPAHFNSFPESPPEQVPPTPSVLSPVNQAEVAGPDQQPPTPSAELTAEALFVLASQNGDSLALVEIPTAPHVISVTSTDDLHTALDAPSALPDVTRTIDLDTPVDPPPDLAEEQPRGLSSVSTPLESQIADGPSEFEEIAIEPSSSNFTEPEVEPPLGSMFSQDQPLASDEPVSGLLSTSNNPDDLGYEARRSYATPLPTKELEWPSAKDILAVHQAARSRQLSASTTKKKRAQRNLMPTLEREPSHWVPPIAVIGSLGVIFIFTAGILGCTLSWWWAHDSYAAAVVTDRLLTDDSTFQRSPLPDSVQPPVGSWLTSTPRNLASWAVYLRHFAAEEKHSPEETGMLLERALTASPVNAQARLAQVLLEPSDSTKSVSQRSIGLSRDAASLASSARRLVEAGKKDEALPLYGRALSFAVPEKLPHYRVPRFSEDPGVPRYLLPGEEPVREIIEEFLTQNTWTFDEWSHVLPENPIVLIATVRILRERGRSEAETILNRILKNSPVLVGQRDVEPVALAVHAEILALSSRFKEASQLYRQAIGLIDDSTVRRSWWFNLADIANRSNDEGARQAALRSASAVAFSDDITRRATDIQRATLSSSTGVKAN